MKETGLKKLILVSLENHNKKYPFSKNVFEKGYYFFQTQTTSENVTFTLILKDFVFKKVKFGYAKSS